MGRCVYESSRISKRGVQRYPFAEHQKKMLKPFLQMKSPGIIPNPREESLAAEIISWRIKGKKKNKEQ